MKVTRNEPPKPFVPVVIMLETQEEVDEMIAIARSRSIMPSNRSLGSLYDAMADFDVNSAEAYTALRQRVDFKTRRQSISSIIEQITQQQPMKPTPPTCAQIANEELGRPIWKQELSGCRHGFDRTAVYARTTDATFWRVSYRVSTNGEYNGLRDGEATIEQVEPYEETVTHYRTISAQR